MPVQQHAEVRFGQSRSPRPATGRRATGGGREGRTPLCPHLQIRSPESMAVLLRSAKQKLPALISFPAKHPASAVLPAARRLCLPASAPR